MFFNGWFGLIRTVIVGVCAYLGLVVLLRISGKRTLSKMNAFDLIVTVALGSTLASILTSKDTVLVEGVLALALLIFLQFVITWISVHSSSFSHLVKAEPRLLVHDGVFLHKAMRAERVTEGEILEAVRSQGGASFEQVKAVVLETDGTFSVIQKSPENSASALVNVPGWEQ